MSSRIWALGCWMHRIVVACFLLGASGYASPSWNSDELALYDLVEAVNANFYELFGIGQDASTAEVKKAYRKLSLEWHPDRNDAPNATAMFRQVLKSTELRAKYDNVLKYGLPDWRQPIYYYRKMRKLSWYEAVLVLTIVSTIAHYFMMWASYYEKYLVLSQTLRKSRRRDRKEENEGSSQQLKEVLSIYRPHFRALLPFLIVKGLWRFFTTLQMVIQEHMSTVEPVKKQSMHENRRVTPVVRPPEFTYEVATDLKAVSPNDPELSAKYRNESEENSKKRSGDIWSCEELYQLWIILGTPNRWERVACVLNRTAQDVTAMAAKLKQIKQVRLLDNPLVLHFTCK
uniref:J domain-containing protein n=1 Tax=Angiostrongylus cantonensis TaxID=6313 RepID=A0A0K0CW55_ANGCA